MIIVITPEPVLILTFDKRNTATSKKFDYDINVRKCQKIVTSLESFRFMTNLEQSGNRIPDKWSVKLTFA